MRGVVIQRAWYDERATLGMLTILDAKHDPIFTLENPKRATTVDSLIPSGNYDCVPYSGTKFKNVYMVKNVPGRSDILIHHGNTEKDTTGCILLGLGGGMIWRDPAVLNSKAAMKLFSELIGYNEFKLIIRDVSFA